MPYYSDEDEDLQVDMSQFELRPRPGGSLFYFEDEAAAPPSSPPDDRPPAIRVGKRGPLPQRWSPPPEARQARPVRPLRAASPAHRRSPSPARRRSPSPAFRRSPSVDRRYPSAYHRSPSPSYRRSNYHRSPSPGYRRSLSPAYPRQSSPPHYSRSPSPPYRGTPVENRARSPRRYHADRSPSPSRLARSPGPRPLQSPSHRDHLDSPFMGLPLARMKITNGHESRSEMQNHRERREPPRQANRRAPQRDVDTSSDDATLRQRRPPPSHRRSKPQYPSNQLRPNKSPLPTKAEPTTERQGRQPTRSKGRSGYSPTPDYDLSAVPYVPEPDY
ncbi:serine/arginine repetitive matrix protein 1-like [Penaeus chinensis]|uniref:serine/arginine repetitive matrix protein 1-like n=1 Tax=Penaeus chinensis TaxID=139456 RepID=UPI001FB7E503|nr:serine/arginine repetitive matrix protein 1-like [Penaeus chinensis]